MHHSPGSACGRPAARQAAVRGPGTHRVGSYHRRADQRSRPRCRSLGHALRATGDACKHVLGPAQGVEVVELKFREGVARRAAWERRQQRLGIVRSGDTRPRRSSAQQRTRLALVLPDKARTQVFRVWQCVLQAVDELDDGQRCVRALCHGASLFTDREACSTCLRAHPVGRRPFHGRWTSTALCKGRPRCKFATQKRTSPPFSRATLVKCGHYHRPSVCLCVAAWWLPLLGYVCSRSLSGDHRRTAWPMAATATRPAWL